MRLQTVILHRQAKETAALCLRTEGTISHGGEGLVMAPGAVLMTDTYMNAFDIGTWIRIAGKVHVDLRLRIAGSGSVSLIHLSGEARKCLKEVPFDIGKPEDIMIRIPENVITGILFFKITSETASLISEAFYETPDTPKTQICLGVVICTYKRRAQVTRQLQMIRESSFFDPQSPYGGRLHLVIVDNASEIPEQEEKGLCIVHNPNTGGSGGFARGMQELRRISKVRHISHVVLMDDDAETEAETFYRLYALLAMAQGDSVNRPVAGRMFRMDQKHVQYTAAEIWNEGSLRHIGHNCDMTAPEALAQMNDPGAAEYGGWWLCCFPMAFAEDHDPLPFFIHCDDVEYGLRYGRKPVILNGIQVWHETYEHRQTPVITYYDTRNPLIVNAIYHPGRDAAAVFSEWFDRITVLHNAGDSLAEYMCIRGMWDFLKGPAAVFQADAQARHEALSRKQSVRPLTNSLLWRLIKINFDKRFSAVIRQYQTYAKNYRRKD